MADYNSTHVGAGTWLLLEAEPLGQGLWRLCSTRPTAFSETLRILKGFHGAGAGEGCAHQKHHFVGG